MSAQDPQAHWQHVYETKPPTEVSWYQAVPETSLAYLRAAGHPRTAGFIDIGGGASLLVDHLLREGCTDLSVLDVAPAALELAKARLGEAASRVHWIAADITRFKPDRTYALWHDRAVFHFLVEPELRDRYLATLRAALEPGGHAILATFGPEGPQRCSGLDTRRYATEELGDLLGPSFRLVRSQLELHRTPSGGTQQFQFGLWLRTP